MSYPCQKFVSALCSTAVVTYTLRCTFCCTSPSIACCKYWLCTKWGARIKFWCTIGNFHPNSIISTVSTVWCCWSTECRDWSNSIGIYCKWKPVPNQSVIENNTAISIPSLRANYQFTLLCTRCHVSSTMRRLQNKMMLSSHCVYEFVETPKIHHLISRLYIAHE